MSMFGILKTLTVLTAILFLVYVVSCAIILPKLVKKALETRLPALIQHQVTVGEVAFNPFLTSAIVRNFKIKSDTEVVLSVPVLELNLDLFSLLKRRIVLDEIALFKPFLSVIVDSKGSINLLKLIPKKSNTEGSKTSFKLPPIDISEIVFKKGEVSFLDFSRRKKTSETFTELDISLKYLSTEPVKKTEFSLFTKSSIGYLGKKLALKGNVGLNPVRSSGKLKATGIELERLFEYIHPFVEFEVGSGIGNLEIGYNFSMAQKWRLRLTEGTGELLSAQLKRPTIDPPVIKVEKLNIEGFDYDITGKDLKIETVKAEKAELNLENNKETGLNVVRLFVPIRSEKKKVSSSKPFQWEIRQIALKDSQFRFKNGLIAQQPSVQLSKLDLQVKGLSGQQNQSFSTDLKAELSPSGVIESSGEMSIFPFSIAQNIESTDISLSLLKPYLDQRTKIDIKSGLADIQGKVSYPYDVEDKPNAAMIKETNVLRLKNGEIRLKTLQIGSQQSKESLIAIRNSSLAGFYFDLTHRHLKIDSIKTSKAEIDAELTKDKSLNLVTLFTPKNSSDTSGKKAEPFKYQFPEININDSEVRFTHHLLPKPTLTVLSGINLRLLNLENVENSGIESDLSFNFNSGGSLTLKGKTWLSPFSTYQQIKTSKVDLSAFSPYLSLASAAKVKKGKLYSDAIISYTSNLSDASKFNLLGDLSIDDLSIWNGKTNEQLANISKLGLDKATMRGFPLSFEIDRFYSSYPQILFSLDEKGKNNFGGLILEKGSKSPKKDTKIEDEKSKVSVEIDKVEIHRGQVQLVDRTLNPYFELLITDIVGQLKSFSLNKSKNSNFSFTANWNDLAPVSIKGKGSLFNFKENGEVAVSARGVNLPSLNPHAIKFFGQTIEKGKLNAKLKYRLNKQELNGENELVFDQLELGKKVESEGAKELPIGFAVDLLKDSEGKLEVDLPIRGDLKTPDFQYGSLIRDALWQAISKTVTSPFRLLASLVTSDKKKFEIAFEPGSYQLSRKMQLRIQDAVEELRKDRDLHLEIKGVYSSSLDRKWAEQKLSNSGAVSGRQISASRALQNQLRNLAKKRAERIYLASKNFGIGSTRLFLTQVEETSSKDKKLVKGELAIVEN